MPRSCLLRTTTPLEPDLLRRVWHAYQPRLEQIEPLGCRTTTSFKPPRGELLRRNEVWGYFGQIALGDLAFAG